MIALFFFSFLWVTITDTRATEIKDIDNYHNYSNYLKKNSYLNLDSYRAAITEQLSLRTLNLDFKSQHANLLSARLYYKNKDNFSYVDIVKDDNDSFLWSSNQQVSQALNISNLRNWQDSLPFDKSFYENFLKSGIFYEDKDIYFDSKNGKEKISSPSSNCSIPKSFIGKFSQELLHSEQFVIYMLTQKVEIDLTDVNSIGLVLVSRFPPCINCRKTLMSELIHKKIYTKLSIKEDVKFNILFFFLNQSNHYKKQSSSSGNKILLSKTKSRLIIVHPEVFIKNKDILSEI